MRALFLVWKWLCLFMAEKEKETAHTWLSSSLYKGTNPIMRVSLSGPHLNSITSQQFYLQVSIRFGDRASMYDFGRGKNIHSISVCVCVLLMRESYMGLGCDELYKPGSYVLVLYFNVRFCPNFWAICLSGRFFKVSQEFSNFETFTWQVFL